MTTGYLHPRYPGSLREFGDRRPLPGSGGCLLVRPISGSDRHDAMGPYPLFACGDWGALLEDLHEHASDLVSVAVVTDPFGGYDRALLERVFQRVLPFKDHLVCDLERPTAAILGKHHRYYVRKAQREVVVSTVDPLLFFDQWVSLYANLVQRHGLRGIKAFSPAAFQEQLAVPGVEVMQARCGDELVGGHIWYLSGEVAYSHLLALTPRGYDLMASYALYAFALEHFRQRARWLDLGSGAGAGAGGGGLAQFKRGFATGTRPVYFCGRVVDAAAYSVLAGTSGDDYFPAYRRGEF